MFHTASKQRIVMTHLKRDVCSSFWLDQTCHVRPRRLDVAVFANFRYLHSCIMIWINEVFLRERLIPFCLSAQHLRPFRRALYSDM
jgi:hypothetical protein